MSHMVTIDIQITDLDALAKACDKLGLELRRNQKTFRWWGYSVGDAPLPAGFSHTDMGQCEHAIAVKGTKLNPKSLYEQRVTGQTPQDVGLPFEVGVVKRRDGKPGYTLMWDSWQDGYGMGKHVGGVRCDKLRDRYAVEVAKKKARLLGYSVKEEQVQGKVRLSLTR